MAKSKQKPVLFVSSTVYGIEELLERIYTLLTAFGYEVWMSHKGTVPVLSNKSAFENCIKAVEKCDLFLGIITPYYGSGKDNDNISITHQELQKAIMLKKPRWLLTHENVVFARKFLNDLGFNSKKRKDLTLKPKSNSIEDLRVIDMYEEAILSEKPLRDRQGNWVQKYRNDEDALLFASAQFGRFQEIEAFISENFSQPERVAKKVKNKGGKE